MPDDPDRPDDPAGPGDRIAPDDPAGPGDRIAPDGPDGPVDVFVRHRSLLFGVAYRMLGSVAEADDVVQETWLRWDRVDHRGVAEPRRYLIRIASRLALDRIDRIRASRERYVGPWLPEPLGTDAEPDDQAAVADSVSMAMLVVLETLSPLERAVFVLHEAFRFSYPEIGVVLGRSEQAVRQLGHRAKQHVAARRPRFRPDPPTRRRVTERFLDAAVGGDLSALMAVLSPDVVLVVDAGGKVRAPRRTIRGAGKVARFFVATAKDVPAGTEIRYRQVNGEPAAVAVLGGVPYTVFVVEPDPDTGRVALIRQIANPDKLAGVRQAR